MTRRGKIARLPREIREELNRRLENGEFGKQLVAWLNGLPETKNTLASSFDGREITEQNLSEWKTGGFPEWQARRDELEQARELAAEAEELGAPTDCRLTDHLAKRLALRYATALSKWDGVVTDESRRKLRALRGLCQDIMELRRGDHSSMRLNLEEERFKRDEEKTEAEVAAQFERWASNQEVRDWVCKHWANPEERDRRLREILK